MNYSKCSAIFPDLVTAICASHYRKVGREREATQRGRREGEAPLYSSESFTRIEVIRQHSKHQRATSKQWCKATEQLSFSKGKGGECANVDPNPNDDTSQYDMCSEAVETPSHKYCSRLAYHLSRIRPGLSTLSPRSHCEDAHNHYCRKATATNHDRQDSLSHRCHGPARTTSGQGLHKKELGCQRHWILKSRWD